MKKPLALVTPCHGAPLSVYTSSTGGSGYQTYEEPSEIVCTAPGCVNSWNPDGTVDFWRGEEV